MSRRGNCYDNGVMEAFFSSVKSETAIRIDSCGEAKIESFDYIEVFYNQRTFDARSDQSGRIRTTPEQRGHGACGKPHRTRFPQVPHPSSSSLKEDEPTKNERLSEPVH